MCFGPTASFSAAGVLILFEVAILKNVKNRRQYLFAAFPLIFALQQFTEGWLWLFLLEDSSPETHHFLSNIFLFIALILWPIYTPLSIWVLEDDIRIKNKLKAILYLSIGLGSYFGYILFSDFYNASIVGSCIQYHLRLPGILEFILFSLYLICVVVPFYMSSQKQLKYFGLAVITFCTITIFAYFQTLISVWCFFAAILSSMIFFIIKNSNTKNISKN